ncbi:MAG: hypothetical protein MZW92_10775 [Comamonadaceae bacterium]|nr:hypothetical protein [Comamonadaceae bacterium]
MAEASRGHGARRLRRRAKFTHAGVTSTFFRRDGRFFVSTDGPDGRLADFEIKYTFGVTPLQQYLVALPGGRLQALGIAWDARPDGAGRAALVPPLPGPQAQGRRPAALDRHRPDLELPVRRLPLDQPAQELRRDDRHATRPPGPTSTSPARPATARARTTSPGRSRKATGSGRRPRQGPHRRARRAPRRHLGDRSGHRQRRALASRATSSREIETCARCHARRGQFTDAWHAGDAARRRLPRRRCIEAGPVLRRRPACATRCSTTARSCRAACTPRASPARTATTRTPASCARRATPCAASATHRRSYDAAAHHHHADGHDGARSARPATCRPRPTWWSTRATTTASASRGPTAR